MATTYTPEAALGSPCPEFALPATDGRTYSRRDLEGAQAALVMFVCNHCPYVQAVEDRLIALGKHFAGKPVKIYAISSNDASQHPEDGFDEMGKRALAKGYPYPYLYDESQTVARDFGAVCTPDFFLYDSNLTLAYRGRLDDSWKNPANVRAEELKSAIETLLEGGRPTDDQKPSMGCSLKWKPGMPDGAHA